MPLGEPGESVSADELETMKILYTADIMYVEKQIMRILDWLDEMNKADNTIVVLTSDHGEEFYDHQAWNHGGSAFNEVLRVPLVIKAAGIIKPGLRIKTCTRHIDILPTILDLAGLENPAGVQGRSLGGLAGGKAMDAVPAYTEVFPIRPAGCSIFSIVSPPYKLISVSLDGKTDYLLYDIDADYTERQNLVSSLPDVYADMVDEMDVWNDVAHLFNPDTEAIPIDPGTLKKLKSLGYVN